MPKDEGNYSLSGYPLCPNDGFPLVEIQGQLTCSVEALDRCLGQQKVVDVIRRNQTLYYVFEDGHHLPLLCSCCGAPLLIEDVAAERRRLRGRRLIAMGMASQRLADGQRVDELILEFSPKGLEDQALGIPVAFEVAAELRHPQPGARPRPGTGAKKKRSRPRSKKRSKKRNRRRK